MPVIPIYITQSDYVQGTYSRFTYSFPQGGARLKDCTCAMARINMYNSVFNITAAYGNNVFQYIWWDNTVTTITLSDGYYDITTINSYLQQIMIQNGHYLVNSSGEYVYYLELIENPTYYAVQFNAYPIPTALPGGYTNPSGMLFPGVTVTPQVTILSNGFQQIIGFNAGTYPTPTQATTYSKLSDFTPQVSPVSCYFISCSLVNNKLSTPTSILYSFAPVNVAFGANFESSPNQFEYVSITDGQYDSFSIEILDQSFQQVKIEDTNVTMLLYLKFKEEQ